MGRSRKKGRDISGWINLDKPAGMTSTAAVGKVRRFLDARKAGHAGTLDPLATGILPIALGEATKTIPFAQDRLKSYSFKIIWGEERETDDAEGAVTATAAHRPDEKDIREILPRFAGDIEQVPPRYSAIKIEGRRAYDLAREGEEPELKSRPVYVKSLTLLEAAPGHALFRCVCGKGTYMRALARDMARALGTAGYIDELRRESVGPFTADNAISLAKLEEIHHSPPPEDAPESILLPVETVLDDIPALALSDREAVRLKNGQTLSFIARPDVERLHRAGLGSQPEAADALAVYKGKPVAIISVQGIEARPIRLFNL